MRLLTKNIIMCTVIACAVILGCTRSNKSSESISPSFYKIDISKDIDNLKESKLSTIAYDIDYIPLQTLPGSYLKDISNIKISNSGIYICDEDKVLKFSSRGMFIKHIGNMGNGPGEYIHPILLAVNEKTNTVWVESENKGILKYDLNGNFLNEPIKLHGISNLIVGDNRIFYYKNGFSESQSEKSSLVVADSNLNELQRFNKLQDKAGAFSFAAGLYYFKDEVFCKGAFNDTIYQIGDLGLKPHAVIELGKHQLPQVFSINDIVNNNTNVVNKYRIHSNIFETDHFLFAELSTLRAIDKVQQNRYMYYDKITTEHFILPRGGFVNDLNNGLPFVPKYSCNDSISVNYADAYRLKEWVNSEQFKTSTPKFPEKKKALETLANSLDENDNPVLMLVKLKE